MRDDLVLQGRDEREGRSALGWDLFVSHRSSDKSWVNALVEALEAGGISCWVDKSQVEPFGGISPAVQEGLAAAEPSSPSTRPTTRRAGSASGS